MTRVAVYADSPELILAGLRACLSRGDVLVPLNRRLTNPELSALLDDARPGLVLVESETRQRLAELCPGLRLIEPSPATAPGLTGAGWLAGPDRPAVRVYTSGTSGSPRPVTLGLDQLRNSAQGTNELLELVSSDRWLCPLPLYHIGGLMVPIRCALVGATPLLGGLDRLSEATIVSLVPTQLARLASAPPPSSLRAVIVGGGPLEPDLQRAAQEAGWPVLPTYGMTEVASMVTCVRPGQRGLGHCGRPLPGHRLLIDGGEILVSRGDGWLRTGDLGRIDERGNLIVDGRREDLILTGGENVRPAEVERALLRHPAVDAACAFGLEDGEWGQRVCAAIVVRGEAVEDVEILARAGESLARYKLPRELIRLDALPRNGLGKLQRALLRERLSARC